MTRAVFFDEEHARAATARLVRDGFEASCERQRFAGEDDDEDHPWVVLSDAPVVDARAARRASTTAGWSPTSHRRRRTPLVLPAAPRRIKREL